MAEEVLVNDDLTPIEVKFYIENPELLQEEIENTLDLVRETIDETAQQAQDAADNAIRSAEDMVAATIQLADITVKRLDIAVGALVSGNTIDPTALEEV